MTSATTRSRTWRPKGRRQRESRRNYPLNLGHAPANRWDRIVVPRGEELRAIADMAEELLSEGADV